MKFTSAISSPVRDMIRSLSPDCDPDLGLKKHTYKKTYNLIIVPFCIYLITLATVDFLVTKKKRLDL